MDRTEVAWAVWDRAVRGGGPDARPGDRALAALLEVHGLAMNGGLGHAIDVLEADELRAGCEGFRSFGFGDAADAIEWLAVQLDRLGPEPDPDAAHHLEQQAEARYDALIPTDAALFDRFQEQFEAHPERFAPLPA